MATYYSTFTSGLKEAVSSALRQQIHDAEIVLLLDGLVIYTSNKPIQLIRGTRFFNNTFLLLRLFPNLKDQNPVQFMANAVFKKPQLISGVPPWVVKGARTFRIVASIENQTAPINEILLAKLERFFSFRLQMNVSRHKPDVEVWFLFRSEGYGFLGVRLPRLSNHKKALQRGELRPELANMLCLISEPHKNDIFLDPFAGSGSIPLERAQFFPYKQVIASEKDMGIFKTLQKEVARSHLRISSERWDAMNLDSLADGYISKIVTDPPWGFYSDEKVEWEDYYSKMLKELIRVLQHGGIIVILMGQKSLFENVMKKFSELTLLEKYDILVSGKKAAIYKATKNNK